VLITGDAVVSESAVTIHTYTFDTTDPGTLDTFTRNTPSCGFGTLVGTPVFNPATGDGSFDCKFLDDVGAGASNATSVSIIITDDDTESGTGSKAVTVNNVAPTITSADATYNQVAGTVTSTITYADAGTPDTETIDFKYTWSGTASGTQTNTYPGRPSSTTVADALHLAPGCYTIKVEMFVTDDDTGVSSFTKNFAGLDFYAASFQAPIKDNERNIAKYGNVVPIKVDLRSMCFGTSVTTPTLHITIANGDVTGDDSIDDSNIVAVSVSNADTGTQMRIAGGGYMYNFSTKTLTQGNLYTIRIREGSTGGPIILKALFQPKK
jgi:hypothetical protein